MRFLWKGESNLLEKLNTTSDIVELNNVDQTNCELLTKNFPNCEIQQVKTQSIIVID